MMMLLALIAGIWCSDICWYHDETNHGLDLDETAQVIDDDFNELPICYNYKNTSLLPNEKGIWCSNFYKANSAKNSTDYNIGRDLYCENFVITNSTIE